MIKKIKNLLIFGLIFLILGFLFLKYSWQLLNEKSELKEFAAKVQNIEPIPDSLMNIYTKVYSYQNNISATEEIFIGYGGILLSGSASYYKNCLCDEIIRRNLFGYRRFKPYIIKRIKSLQLSFGLESIVGSKACLNYYVMKDYEELGSIIKNYPYSWKNKNINELSKREFIEFLVINNGPISHNKFLNFKKFVNRKQKIERKINNNI